MKNKIYNSLPHGRKNAVSAEYLCALHGFKSHRELRQQVQRERLKGAVIASGDDGYYIPDSRGELLAYVHRYESMAKTIFATLGHARAELAQIEGQQAMDHIGD